MNNVCYISLRNPFSTMKKLKGVFKSLQCYFKCGKYWNPILWCSKPHPIQIISRDVGWKDKYDSPRYEQPPFIWIYLFGINFIWYWDLPDHIGYNPEKDYIDDYWEQALWYLYYYNTISYGRLDAPNIDKAKESWPWQDYETSESSWNNKFLIK